MLRAWPGFVARRAGAIVAASALVTLLALLQLVDAGALRAGRWADALRLEVDPTQSSVLPRADASRRHYDRVREIFGNDETLLVLAHRPQGIYEPAFLAALARAGERIEEIAGIRSVLSLATLPDIRSAGGEIEILPFYEEAPAAASELAQLRAAVEANPILHGNLVSRDGTSAALVVHLLDLSEKEFTSRAIDEEVDRIAREEFGGAAELWITGGARVKAELTRYLLRDLLRVIPAAFLLMALIAFLAFRTARGVAVPVLTVGIGVLWALAFTAWWNPRLDIVTVSAPAVLLAVGFAYGVHVVSAYYEAAAQAPGRPAREIAARGLEQVLLATLLTGATTVAGFLSLATNPIPAIRNFGVFTGVGTACSMLAASALAPALLALLPVPARLAARPAGASRFDRALARLAGLVARRRRRVLWIGAGVAGVALLGIPQIRVSTNVVSSFPAGSAVRESVEAANRLLGASDQIYLIVEADYADAFKQPVNLLALASLQDWLAAQPEVGGSSSLADYVELLYRGFEDGDPAYHRIPDTSRLVSQLLLFGASDQTRRLVDSRYQIASIPVRIAAIDSGDVVDFAERVEARLATLPPQLRGSVTGASVLLARTNDEIAIGQALSFGSATLLIYAMLALLFMSLRVGLLAMLPNLLPIAIYFGALGWTGITLNVVTGLVASLVLGIAVDDTIHMLERFRTAARRHASEEAGIREAMGEVGRAVSFTTAALCLGFLVITLSSLRQQVEFGALAAATIAVAWITDLSFTPALAVGMRIVTLWDVLTLDLGDEPERAIPLFRGLTRAQARIAALMTQLSERPAGFRLIEAGRAENAMYLVIEGELQASVDQEGQSIELDRHRRGDVIGEVGLFTGLRSANVDCITPVRLLRLDPENLARLDRRYPRIAARLFRNLSETLAARLSATTARLRLAH